MQHVTEQGDQQISAVPDLPALEYASLMATAPGDGRDDAITGLSTLRVT